MRIQQAMAALVVAPVLVLAACGGDDSQDDSDEPTVTTEMGITITGKVGEEPTLTIPADEPTGELQVEVVSEGDGPEVAAHDVVVANYLGQTWKPRAADGSAMPTDDPASPGTELSPRADASAGADAEPTAEADAQPYVFDSSYGDQPRGFPLGGVIAGWRDALAGQKVGSRVLMAIPPELGYGAAAGHDLQNDTLVFVVDIMDAIGADTTASGDPVGDLPEDLPTVTGDEGEPPAVDLSGARVPEQSDSTLVIAGQGPELADNVVVNMVQASYPDGANRISTWDEQEQPLVLASAQLQGIPGLTEAMDGHGVGSRVITRVAPADNPGQDGAPGMALVLVIDIVGTF